MLGEFFGVTGTTSALLELDSPTVNRLSSVMNNPLDVKGLGKFKMELLYLCDFIDNKIEITYASPQIRKLTRQISLIQSNSVDQLKRIYKCDIEGMSDDEKVKLISSIERDIEGIVAATGVKQSVTNNFRKFNDTDEIVTLGDYELMIMLKYKTYYRKILNNYLRLIQLNSFKEITVFGERLHRIASIGPGFLLGVVERMFAVPGANLRQLSDVCLEGVEILRLHYPNTNVRDNGNGLGGKSANTIDFRNYFASSHGYNVINIPEGPLRDKMEKLGGLFDEQSTEFKRLITTLSTKGMINPTTTRDLIELYYNLFRLDHDYEYLCAQLFPEGENVVLGKEELEGVFERLNDVGFYLFSLDNSKLMVESLKKLSFSSESKTTIDPDFEKSNITFGKAIDLIETLSLDIKASKAVGG